MRITCYQLMLHNYLQKQAYNLVRTKSLAVFLEYQTFSIHQTISNELTLWDTNPNQQQQYFNLNQSFYKQLNSRIAVEMI